MGDPGGIFHGPLIAALTPFTEAGAIDYGALRAYLEFLERQGVRSILANSTNGEFPSLSIEERRKILKYCRKHFPGQVVNNVSTTSVGDTSRLLEEAADQADGAILLPPFYYEGTPEQGRLEFFRGVIRESKIPVMLYNFPRHTQAPITPAMLKRLAEEYELLAAIKDSSGDLRFSRSLAEAAPRIQVFPAADPLAWEVLEQGMAGSISGTSNPVAEWLVEVRDAFEDGRSRNGKAAQTGLGAWIDFVGKQPSGAIAVAKAGVASRLMGFPLYMRPPWVQVDPETASAVDHWLSMRSDLSFEPYSLK